MDYRTIKKQIALFNVPLKNKKMLRYNIYQGLKPNIWVLKNFFIINNVGTRATSQVLLNSSDIGTGSHWQQHTKT